MHDNHPLVIIPAAGYGRRSGSSGSKELLPGVETETLISFHFRQALDRGWPVHLITRQAKEDLIAYARDYQRQNSLEITIQLIDSSREWPETVLQSQEFWRAHNFLCLPDTVYAPRDVLDDMRQKMQVGCDLCVASFHCGEKQNTWGYIQSGHGGEILICEKPQNKDIQESALRAWGLIGFSREIGKSLLEAQLESTFDHRWKSIRGQVLFSNLSQFLDTTRGEDELSIKT